MVRLPTTRQDKKDRNRLKQSQRRGFGHTGATLQEFGDTTLGGNMSALDGYKRAKSSAKQAKDGIRQARETATQVLKKRKGGIGGDEPERKRKKKR